MVIPKFDINQIVFVYDKGKLVERVVNKIQILITDKEFKVGYQFDTDSFRVYFREYYTDESEVFKSMDDFIKHNQTT